MKPTNKTTILTTRKRITQLNETVTTEEEAKSACIKKWNLAKEYLDDLWCFSDVTCGFCALADHRRDERSIRCNHCPPPINKYCDSMRQNLSNKWAELEDLFNETIWFLNDYEPQGEEE